MVGSDLEGADPESRVPSWAASATSDDAAAMRAVIEAYGDRLTAADVACVRQLFVLERTGPLEDHAVHVPADAGAGRRGLLRHLAGPPPGFGTFRIPVAVAEHDAAPATPTSTCPYRGRAGRRRA